MENLHNPSLCHLVTQKLCERHLEICDKIPGDINDQVMEGIIVAHTLVLMLEYEFISQGDRTFFTGDNTLSSYVKERFDLATADYHSFKATFLYEGGRMFMPTNPGESPSFEFNPNASKPSRGIESI